jgi:hypothetical protein
VSQVETQLEVLTLNVIMLGCLAGLYCGCQMHMQDVVCSYAQSCWHAMLMISMLPSCQHSGVVQKVAACKAGSLLR